MPVLNSRLLRMAAGGTGDKDCEEQALAFAE
jgi:hypothetical protein